MIKFRSAEIHKYEAKVSNSLEAITYNNDHNLLSSAAEWEQSRVGKGVKMDMRILTFIVL